MRKFTKYPQGYVKASTDNIIDYDAWEDGSLKDFVQALEGYTRIEVDLSEPGNPITLYYGDAEGLIQKKRLKTPYGTSALSRLYISMITDAKYDDDVLHILVYI